MKVIAVILSILILPAIIITCEVKNEKESIIWTAEDRQQLLSDLQRSRDSLFLEIQDLDTTQLNFKSDSANWSILEIVEHLIWQDILYYRELTNIATRPKEDKLLDLRVNDSLFQSYATDPNRTQSGWYAIPRGLCTNKDDCWQFYAEIRDREIQFITTTDVDFRRHYTYRNIADSLLDQEFYRIRKVRDLHQLVINQIAHTRRHIAQIKKVKGHGDFPGD